MLLGITLGVQIVVRRNIRRLAFLGSSGVCEVALQVSPFKREQATATAPEALSGQMVTIFYLFNAAEVIVAAATSKKKN